MQRRAGLEAEHCSSRIGQTSGANAAYSVIGICRIIKINTFRIDHIQIGICLNEINDGTPVPNTRNCKFDIQAIACRVFVCIDPVEATGRGCAHVFGKIDRQVMDGLRAIGFHCGQCQQRLCRRAVKCQKIIIAVRIGSQICQHTDSHRIADSGGPDLSACHIEHGDIGYFFGR